MLLDEAKVTGDFAADLFQVFEFTLEFITSHPFIVQLSFELRDVGLATHLAELRLSWNHLGSRFEIFWHIANVVLGLLIVVSFIGVIIGVLNIDVIKVATELLLNLVE